MPLFREQSPAFGFPGAPATWAPANKQGFGTACSGGSRVWFTIAGGVLTEAFYPRTDTPQVREIQLVFTAGPDVFLEEKGDFEHQVERMAPAQGYRVRSSHRPRELVVSKQIIASPTHSSIMAHTELGGPPEWIETIETFVLCTPHLDDTGLGNNAQVVSACGRQLLAAERDGTWLAIDVSCGFTRLSCGYVGSSDGYTDLSRNRRMTWEFDHARQGNVMLTGQLDLAGRREFELCVAFGDTLEGVVAALFQSLTVDYEAQRRVFVHQWTRKAAGHKRLANASRDREELYQASYSLLLAAGAVDVLQADATRCQGISGFLRADALCGAHSMPLSAHTSPSIHAHAGCACQRLINVEYFFDHVRLEKMAFDGAIEAKKGMLQPDFGAPGFGLTWKEADMRQYQAYGVGDPSPKSRA